MSGWTEERTEALRVLWNHGFSASVCAERLGDVTRNAVIGKVYRLGLARNATTTSGRRAAPRNHVAHLPLRPTRVQYRRHGNVALKPAFTPAEKPLRLAPSIAPEAAPVALQVALLDLKENMCRWPIGDPQDENFHFCGHPKAPGVSYCEHHAQKVFQPAARRRR